MSFKYKTILGIASIEAILLSIIIWNALVYLNTLSENELSKRTSTTINLLATTAKDAVISTDIASLESLLNDVVTDKDIIYVRIFDTDHVLAQKSNKEYLNKKFSEDISLRQVTDGVFDTTADITEADEYFGRIEIGFSTRPFEVLFNQAQKKITGIAIIEIALSALFSFVLGTLLVRQLQQLREASKRIADGEIGFQIQTTGTDEIGETAQTFNLMSAQLKAYLSEIEKKNLALQHEITQRENAHQALAAEKEQLSVTLRSIGDGVITTDINGNIILINKIAEKLIGYSQAEGKNQPVESVFNIVDSKTLQPLENPVQRVSETGEAVQLKQQSLLLSKDGTKRNISGSCASICCNKNLVNGTILVFRDESEKLRMETELLNAKKLESVGILAGGIAHDFNNILSTVLGNINLSQFALSPSEKTIHTYQADAEKACLMAKGLTQQLLTFSKGGAPVKQLSSISNIIKDSVNFVLSGCNISPQYRFEDNLWPAELDAGQISQVVQNIAINARQAMPDGGNIDIECTNFTNKNDNELPLSPGSYLKLIITDHGTGIPEELLEKVFDPYFTTKRQGNGLGLAITHSIITKHEGFLQLSSKINKGTSFTIYLPAVINHKIIDPENTSDTDPPKNVGRILIMDDNELLLKMVSSYLEETFKMAVTCAQNGNEAVELYKQAIEIQDPFEVSIMDLTIPGGMGGKEAAEIILSLNPQAKIIVSSGYSNDPILANHKEHGFRAILPKPFQLKNLMEVLRKTLTPDSPN